MYNSCYLCRLLTLFIKKRVLSEELIFELRLGGEAARGLQEGRMFWAVGMACDKALRQGLLNLIRRGRC